MREHLYKAKRVDSGEWIFGHFMIGLNGEYYIIHEVQLEGPGSETA